MCRGMGGRGAWKGEEGGMDVDVSARLWIAGGKRGRRGCTLPYSPCSRSFSLTHIRGGEGGWTKTGLEEAPSPLRCAPLHLAYSRLLMLPPAPPFLVRAHGKVPPYRLAHSLLFPPPRPIVLMRPECPLTCNFFFGGGGGKFELPGRREGLCHPFCMGRSFAIQRGISHDPRRVTRLGYPLFRGEEGGHLRWDVRLG